MKATRRSYRSCDAGQIRSAWLRAILVRPRIARHQQENKDYAAHEGNALGEQYPPPASPRIVKPPDLYRQGRDDDEKPKECQDDEKSPPYLDS